MAAAIALGGFTGPEADTLGYAIRKKKSAVLRAQKDKFVKQAAERGVEAGVIDAVFKAFEPFERYGFNKAHATCYGLLAYQTAYLKANYPVEYMTSVLSAFRDNTDKVGGAIAECRRIGIEVLGPDVRHSHVDFTVEDVSIRFGLLAIKNVGESAIQSIIDARDADGEFKSLADLCARVDLRLVNKRVLEALIKVNALNSLGHPAQLLVGLDEAMSYGQTQARDRATGQGSLFDMLGAEESPLEQALAPATEAPSRERLRWEKELLGLYLSDHPLGELAAEMSQYTNATSGDIGEPLDQQRVVVGGMSVAIRRVITRNKESMAVVTLEDLQGSVDVVVFPRTFTEVAPKLTDDAVLIFAGRVDHKGDETVVLCDAVWTWDEATEKGRDRFAQEVAAGDRGRGRRRRNGAGVSDGNGHVRPPASERPPSPPDPPAIVPTETLVVPRVSPLRGALPDGTITIAIGGPAPARSAPGSRASASIDIDGPSPLDAPPPIDLPGEPVNGASGPPAFEALVPEGRDEPALPDEAGAVVTAAAEASTVPVAAGPGQVMHIRFEVASDERIVAAFGDLRSVIKAHPGSTSVVLHIPAGAGRTQEMRLGVGVAYDSELVAEIGRRCGPLLSLELV